MSLSVSELQTMLDKLRRARASGVLSVRHGDEQVQYKSDKEMKAAIADVEVQIAAAGGTRRTRILKAYQSGKGL